MSPGQPTSLMQSAAVSVTSWLSTEPWHWLVSSCTRARNVREPAPVNWMVKVAPLNEVGTNWPLSFSYQSILTFVPSTPIDVLTVAVAPFAGTGTDCEKGCWRIEGSLHTLSVAPSLATAQVPAD